MKEITSEIQTSNNQTEITPWTRALIFNQSDEKQQLQLVQKMGA